MVVDDRSCSTLTGRESGKALFGLMSLSLTPLMPGHRAQFEQALQATHILSGSFLSALAWAPHLIWSGEFQYFWVEVKGWGCLFAEYADGMYMPLPPLGPLRSRSRPPEAVLSYEEVVATVFSEMARRNEGSSVSRIENIPEGLQLWFASSGYGVREKDPDYLYRTEDLIALKGDRYKSQRAACNQFQRLFQVGVEPYQPQEENACLDLFDRWVRQKREMCPDPGSGGESDLSGIMLDQSRQAHRLALFHHDEWGLIGRVARVNQKIAGYTFGYERTPEVWCVLLEVTDRTIPGLAPYLFREGCRERAHYAFLNTMDDSGLAEFGSIQGGLPPYSNGEKLYRDRCHRDPKPSGALCSTKPGSLIILHLLSVRERSLMVWLTTMRGKMLGKVSPRIMPCGPWTPSV